MIVLLFVPVALVLIVRFKWGTRARKVKAQETFTGPPRHTPAVFDHYPSGRRLWR